MENMRWTNRNHPQTLFIGVILLYFDAVISLISPLFGAGLGLLITIAAAASGWGIANDKRIAWYTGIAVSAIIPFFLARILWRDGLATLFDFDFLLTSVFPVAQLTALVHPMSRSYTRVYFE